MYDPNVKLVDLYKDGVWKCKVAYKKVETKNWCQKLPNFEPND